MISGTSDFLRPSSSRSVNFCKTCLMPSSRPRIVFDEEGVCNACRYAEYKKQNIDWTARETEFLEMIAPYKQTQGQWDCVVPWSGGKDSSSIAHKLKFKFGLNPLLVTFSPMIPNEVGVYNRESLIRQGFDHIMIRPNQKVQRELAKRFFVERGNPKVCWDAGVNAAPVRIAVQYNIPLIFYAEHGESEYGGKVLNETSSKLRDFTEVLEHQIGDDPRNWESDTIAQNELLPYLYPEIDKVNALGVKALYYAYFFKWSMFENYQYVDDAFPFKTHEFGRTIGTFTNFDSLDDKIDDLYYYMQYIKFGFGRCVRDTSRFINNDHMTREEGLEFCRRYEGEFPKYYFEEVLEYLDLREEEFYAIVDKHRNPEIWDRTSDSEWKLKFPVQ